MLKYVFTLLAVGFGLLTIQGYIATITAPIVFVALLVSKIIGWYTGSWLWVFLWPVITGVGGFVVLFVCGSLAGIFAVAVDEVNKKGDQNEMV